MVKRVKLNPKAAGAVKAKVVPIRRTPLGVMSLVHRPDVDVEKKIFEFAANLLNEEQMAALLGMEENELRLTYARTIAKGRADTIWKVAQAVVEAGSGKSAAMNKEQMSAALFVLKSFAGMSENPSSGPNNGGASGDAGGNKLDDAGRKRQLARLLKFAGAAAARGHLGSVSLAPEPGTTD